MIRKEGTRADILIVDDVTENLEFLSAELTQQGYYIRPVNSGKLALMAARASMPDLVLLDILMPDMNGYEVCQAFKADPALTDIPILFVSGLNETIDKVRAFQAGGVDFITKPFQLEEVLARIETHLTLYWQRRELEQQRELKARFVSMATHEFRTPLTVIKTSVFLILRNFQTQPTERTIEKLNLIGKEVDELDRLIEDILNFNRMDMGRLEFRPQTTNVRAFCDRIAERFSALSETQALVYTFDNAISVAAFDPRLLSHVLTNLLSNAFKYSPAGSRVSFDVSQDEQNILFRVVDEGIGIPPHEQKHLFAPFYRASNARPYGGTGLGLCIVKQYAERHGGEVTFESRENIGTTFLVRIPRGNV